MRAALLVAVLAGRAWADPTDPPLAPSFPLSASALFEATVAATFSDARDCWATPGLPNERTQRRHAQAINRWCARFWPGDATAPYRMLALMWSESHGELKNQGPDGERSYGPYCGTVEEARENGRLFPDLGVPRTGNEIAARLQESADFAASMVAATLWRYDRAQGGDRMRGTLIYKMGAAKLTEVTRHKPADELTVWRRYSAKLRWIGCQRDLLDLNAARPCACERPE